MQKLIRPLLYLGLGLLSLIGLAVLALQLLVDESRLKAQLIESVQAQTGRQLQLQGELDLRLWPEVGLHTQGIHLSEADGQTPFAQLDSLRVAVAVLPLLRGRVEVEGIHMQGLQLQLRRDRHGRLNVADLLSGTQQDSTAPAAAPNAPDKVNAANTADSAIRAASAGWQLDIRRLALRDTRLSWHDQASGQQLQLSSLQVESGPVQADGTTGSLTIEALRLETRGESGPHAFAGHLTLPQLQLKAGRLESAYAGQLDIKSPSLPMQRLQLPLQGQLQVDLTQAGPRAGLTLATRLEAAQIALKLQLAGLAPLNLDFDLNIDQLNLDPYLQTPPAIQPQAPTQTPAQTQTQTPHPTTTVSSDTTSTPAAPDLAVLHEIVARGQVSIGRLQLMGLRASQFKTRVNLGQGQLALAPLEAELYAGKLQGSLTLAARGPRLQLRQTLSGIDIHPLIRDLSGKEPLEGRGNLALDVHAVGSNADALLRSLAGQARFDLRDGAIRGINLAQLLRDAKAKLQGGFKGSAAQAAIGGTSGGTTTTEKTDFSELKASFQLRAGVAHNEDLLMKSPFLRLGGAGDIDLGRRQLDYLARVSVVNTSTGQAGRDLAELKGITLPLRLRGPFTQIRYSLDTEALLRDVAQARLEEKKSAFKEEAGRKLQDKLGDRLKGLFGR